MRKRCIKGLIGLILGVFFITACNQDKSGNKNYDSPIRGTIHISVDESFRPVIEEQIRVYESLFPGTEIIAAYKPEVDCLKDFFRDSSTRMVIVTRGLTDNEDRYLSDSLKYIPGWNKIANDAIAIIVNAESNDTLFSMERLRKQLTGKLFRNQTVVFDGLTATSTFRFINDSILKGIQVDSTVVKAAKNSTEVIEYVERNKEAVGLVGISWVGNPEDSAQVNRLKKIKIAYMQCDFCKDTPYVKPLQQSINTRRYPMVRGLHYILKENYYGLGNGFVEFLKYERGQLIFKRAYLGTIMDFEVRNVKINQKL